MKKIIHSKILICLLLLANQTLAQTQPLAPSVPNRGLYCNINLQDLNEVVHKSLQRSHEIDMCMGLKNYNMFKSWKGPIAVATAMAKKYTPKDKDGNLGEEPLFYFRDYKILSSKDVAPIDGKSARSYQIKVLYVLMSPITDGNTFIPLCETETYEPIYVKEDWGWHPVPNIRLPGLYWDRAIEISKNHIDQYLTAKTTDTSARLQAKAVSREKSIKRLEREIELAKQCQQTLN